MDSRVLRAFNEYVEFLIWLNEMNQRVGLPTKDFTDEITWAWKQALHYGTEGGVA